MAQEAQELDSGSNGKSAALAKIDTRSEAERAWSLVQRKATAFSHSSLVPSSYQGQNGMPNVIIAMELADRIGANPLMVMQNLHVVQGRPSWSSSFLIACVNTCGRFTPLRYEFSGTPGKDDWSCRAVAKDKDTREVLEGEWITWRMAKEEGWTTKKGSKWLTMPGQMFRYRAAAFWTRVYAPELSLGMHTSEEMGDIGLGPAQMGAMAAVNVSAMPAELVPGDTRTLEASLRGEVMDPATGEMVDAQVSDPASNPGREPGDD